MRRTAQIQTDLSTSCANTTLTGSRYPSIEDVVNGCRFKDQCKDANNCKETVNQTIHKTCDVVEKTVSEYGSIVAEGSGLPTPHVPLCINVSQQIEAMDHSRLTPSPTAEIGRGPGPAFFSRSIFAPHELSCCRSVATGEWAAGKKMRQLHFHNLLRVRKNPFYLEEPRRRAKTAPRLSIYGGGVKKTESDARRGTVQKDCS